MYELILEGIASDAHKARLKRALKAHGSQAVIELEEALDHGPLTIDVAPARGDLMPLYRELKLSGGKVLIVNRHGKAKSRDTILPHVREIHEKKKSLDQLARITAGLRSEGKRVVLVHGVFDILHIGHIRLLNQARDLGDVLVVSITTDNSVGRGPGSPFFTDALRGETLANLSVVDYVTTVESEHAVPVIDAIKPDVLVRGQHVNRKKYDFKADRASLEDAAMKRIRGKSISVEGTNHSTSELAHKFLEIYPQKTSAFLVDFARRWKFDDIIDAVEKCRKLKVLVVGDAILDHYHYCRPLGKSAKENLVVNKALSEEIFAGGIFATANHVAQMCERVDLLTVLGEQNSREEFIREKLDPKVRPYFFYRANGGTTVKKRYVAKESNQKLFEICDLNDSDLNETEQEAVLDFLTTRLADYDLVVVNDFGHGMLTSKLMNLLSEKAKCLALNVQVNGANHGFNLVTNYKKADFVCIDERELRLATRDKHASTEELMKKIARSLKCEQLIATQGADGSVSINDVEGLSRTPAFATSSIDKIGAGDAFFAYTAPCFAAGLSQELTSFIGNCVGALKVQIIGNKEQVRLPDVLRFIERLLKH